MTNKQVQSFRVINILYPKIDFILAKPKGNVDFDHTYRCIVNIENDNQIIVSFGIGLFEKKTECKDSNQDSLTTRLIVESLCSVEFKEPLSKMESINDVPMIANILATIYPFLREKVNYCFSSNGIPMLLPPIDIVSLVQKGADIFKVEDSRTKKKPKKQLEKTK